MKETASWQELSLAKLAISLNEFAAAPGSQYSLAAKEAVNNKKERVLRNTTLLGIIDSCLE
jgi:hypothetical protein